MSKLFFFFLLLLASCYHVSDDVKPKLNYAVQDRYLKQLPSPFPPLSLQERNSDWGRELLIGEHFAHELDLYQALTAFKRAEFLLPAPNDARHMQLQYDELLCYYLGKKYQETVHTYETGILRMATPSFPAYQDLLIILHDAYLQLDQENRAEQIFERLQQTDPAKAEQVALSSDLMRADIAALKQNPSPAISELLTQYASEKKSIGKAQGFNALLPGAGYLYLGQTQSALTAFFLNGLFIWATVHFFQHHQYAAGGIFASFEAGWYFGGIYGAGQEAKFYNERQYEKIATPLMHEKRLFPILMLQYGF